MKGREPQAFVFIWLIALTIGFSGCARAMRDDSRTKPLAENDFFTNRMSARVPPDGTVDRGTLRSNESLYTGKSAEGFVEESPVALTRKHLERGQQRYEIYCTPCHDSVGDGHGMIVQRGFKQPVPFSDARLRGASAGYLFNAISDGYRTMLPMASQISVEDRWAIVSYIRVLQRSQHASLNDVPIDQRGALEETK